jgi:hypothetical protein
MSLWSPDRNPKTAATEFKEASKGSAGTRARAKRVRGGLNAPAARCIAQGKFGTARHFSGRISAEGGVVDSTPADGTENSGAPPLTRRYQIDLHAQQTPGLDFSRPKGNPMGVLVTVGTCRPRPAPLTPFLARRIAPPQRPPRSPEYSTKPCSDLGQDI